MKALIQNEETYGLRVAPLIDIVFLLLIFFLVATTFYEAEKDLNVRLAEATEGEDRAVVMNRIVINIRDSGLLVVNERIISLEELHEMLREAISLKPDIPVVIRCDRRTEHQYFVRVLNLCEKLDVSNIAVATFETDE